MRSTPKIAVIDDDSGILELIRSALEREGFSVDTFAGSRTFLDRAQFEAYDLILSDLMLPEVTGIDLLREVRDKTSAPRFVIITGAPTVATAVQAMKDGADDFLVKPFRLQELVDLAHRLTRTVEGERADPAASRHHVGLAVGRSAAWTGLLEKARRVAELPSTVLIRGETGTGKEVLARYIASFGPRAGKPFVILNCAAMPEQLIESELFGHVRGAFTGATAPRRGLFEEADGGIIFLDEIGTLPLQAQAKLLRVLEERHVRRVGDNRSAAVDVRILAASNLDMEAAVARHDFREDLYYRISVVTLWIPPLRERTEDIPVLAEHFLKAMARGGQPKALAAAAGSFLRSYSFPGNVRELKHALEQAVAFAKGSELAPEDFLFLKARSDFIPPLTSRPPETEPKDVTPGALEDALVRAGNNRVEAARLLGISRSSLYRLMRKRPVDPKGDGDAQGAAR